jgi:hypothetical protein
MLNWRNPLHWAAAIVVVALVILILSHTATT